MRPLDWTKQASVRYLERLRLRLARQQVLLPLALLGIISGIIAGLSMVVFRLVIEASPALLLGTDQYLAPLWRLLLPIIGGIIVGYLLERLASTDRQVGVVHVMERLAYHEGHLPIKNAGVQFLGAAVCIGAGHSVGHEGPAVHIGAASGSWIGQHLRLPNNCIRILVGCGSAGAIAAAFDTPLAGVIFAMEVVMVEYTLASFTPIILAAVSATTVSQWVFGPTPRFVAPEFGLSSLGELAYIVLMGILIGVLASLFVHLLVFFSTRFKDYAIRPRMFAAGVIIGLLALAVPEIMGTGYATVNAALMGILSLELMLAIVVCKLLATTIGLGLGLPAGLIGPTLVIGSAAGGALGIIVNLYTPGSTSPTFYAMLGMGAMMGATLNAPLAALTALLELTANPHIILPGMLAIVAAGLTSQQGFGTSSVFLKLLEVQGLSYRSDPISQFLRRLGVTGSMEHKLLQLPRQVERSRLESLLSAPSTWLLTRDTESHAKILFTADLIRYLEQTAEQEHFDLFELPIHTLDVAPVSAQATLLGALRRMDAAGVDALYVTSPRDQRILGVITRKDIERSYRYQSS